jgi:subtilase family protein
MKLRLTVQMSRRLRRAGLAASVLVALALALAVSSPAAAAGRAPLVAPATPTDPLLSDEWWRADVRVDTLTPPPAGVPVTLVDSGVSFGHPEFKGDANLVALNNQEPAPIGGVHGTATASVVAAPINGVGLVGIYPTATLRTYDASLGDGTQLPAGEIAAGIVAAAKAGRSVINLSLGGPSRDRVIQAAVDAAVRAGSLVVAAAGNSGEEGDWLSYPAASAHVLTVGATDENDEPASFTTSSPFVDLAAPGVDIPVASALDNSYQSESGTSFSSPLVAGAAAWLWTVRPDLDASQVAQILRDSARDVGPPGYDDSTGYGILDLAAALNAPTPQRDSAEPNDTTSTATVVTTRSRATGSTSGRVARFEDPRDVFRVWLPPRKRVTVGIASDNGVAVTLAGAHASGAKISLSVLDGKTGRTAYLTVTPVAGARSAVYTLKVSVR